MAESHRICSVPDCGKSCFAAGYCSSHYLRLRRHGDPLGGGAFRNSERMACSVEGCQKPQAAKGYCNSHYARWKRHGDYASGGASRGELLAWLEANKAFEDDACLPWPFSIGSGGYGALRIDGTGHNASHVMCLLAHGKPGKGLEAAHSCGNRICCNPKHLRWATKSGNHADKLDHGTDNRGEKHPLARLTEDDVREIRSLKGTTSQREIAARFDIDRSTVAHIQSGKGWRWLE